MSTIGSLLINISANNSGLKRALAESGVAVQGFEGAMGHAKGVLGGFMGQVGALAGPAGMLGLVGAVGYSAKAAVDFQQQMKMIQTQAGASAAEVATMSQSVLDMATSVGTAPDELAKGLFHLESAGFRSATAVNALRIAAEGAKVGGANLEDVTNALDAVLVAGGNDAKNMAASMGELNAIVGSGDMHMQDLADAMGTGILATAHTFGLSLKDIGAALATMGDNNIRGAEAATKLRMTISLMGAPSGAATKALKNMGLSAVQLNEDMRTKGLTGALEDLKKHLDNISFDQVVKQSRHSAAYVKAHWSTVLQAIQAQDLAHAFGGGKSGGTVQLLLEQLDRMKGKFGEIGAASGTFADAWAQQQQTAAQKLADFSTALNVLAVNVGNAILPTLTDSAQAVAGWVSTNQASIVGFVNQVISTVRSIGAVLLNTVLPALESVGSKVKGIWDGLPAPLRSLLIEAVIGNKVIKAVFGISIMGTIESAAKTIVEKAFSGIGSLLGGKGGLLGDAVGQRVFVTNFPPGFGGVPAPAEDAGIAGGLVSGIKSGLKFSLLGVALPELILNQIKGLFPGVNGAPGGGNTLPIGGFSGANNSGGAAPGVYGPPSPTAQALAGAVHDYSAERKAEGNWATSIAIQAQVPSILNRAFANLMDLTLTQVGLVSQNLQLQTVAAEAHHRMTYTELLHASHEAHTDHVEHVAHLKAIGANVNGLIPHLDEIKNALGGILGHGNLSDYAGKAKDDRSGPIAHTTHVHVHLDGQKIAQVIDRRLFDSASGSSSGFSSNPGVGGP